MASITTLPKEQALIHHRGSKSSSRGLPARVVVVGSGGASAAVSSALVVRSSSSRQLLLLDPPHYLTLLVLKIAASLWVLHFRYICNISLKFFVSLSKLDLTSPAKIC